MILQGQDGEGKRPKPLMIEWPTGTPAAHVVLFPFFYFLFLSLLFACIILSLSLSLLLKHPILKHLTSCKVLLSLQQAVSTCTPQHNSGIFKSFGQEAEPDKGSHVDVHRQVSTDMVWLALFLSFS